MKIVHICEAWAGGISTYVKTLIEHQLQSEQFDEVTLLYSENRTNANLEEEFASNKKLKLYPYKSSRNPLHFCKIARQIDKILIEINPDAVHLHSTFAGVYGRIYKRFPTIYCAHGWAFTQDISCLKKRIYGAVEKYLAKKTDAVIHISRNEMEAADRLCITCPINIVIFNGVADKKISIVPISLKVDSNNINIGFIGRLDHQKGFDLIEPFFRNNPAKNIKLYVIGEAERSNKKTYPACDNITYLGWVDNKEIDSYMSMFDTIIMPSRYEGFGLVAIEAMRNSKPVIVSNRGALPELIINGFNGYVFDLAKPEAELATILEKVNKQSLAKMREKARDVYLSNFTSERFCDEITQIYKKVAA